MKKNLIIDASNLLYRTFFVYSKDKDAEDILVGLCYQSALMLMNTYYRKFKPDQIIMVFDAVSWRKMYTSDLSTCITHKKYKGQRRKKLSTSETEKLDLFDQHVTDFHDILKKKTKIMILRGSYLEADYLIAGYVQKYDEDDNIIVSMDKDFIQLLVNPNVTLIDPQKNQERSLQEWDNDADLFMFEKCIRGDASDNVQSSYPRIRKTKIVEAYNDDFVCANIMEHEFKVPHIVDGNPIELEYKTKELFKENELLMDLTMQPSVIKDIMKKSIKKEVKRIKKGKARFDYYAFMRFCAQCGMDKVVQNLESMSAMLSNKQN